jgi:hypothetical protein
MSKSSLDLWIARSSFTPRRWGFTLRARDRIEHSGLGTPMDFVHLELGGATVELISYEGEPVEPALGCRMIALEVDDMKAAADI